MITGNTKGCLISLYFISISIDIDWTFSGGLVIRSLI